MQQPEHLLVRTQLCHLPIRSLVRRPRPLGSVNPSAAFVVVAGMKRLLRLAGAAAALTLAIAACSSGDDSSDSAAPSVATTTSAAAPTTSAPGGGEATGTDDNGGGGSDDNGPAASTGTITIKDFAFGAPLTVKPGATISVSNQDTTAHDVASDDAGNFRTPLLNKGESATFTAPTQPGTYKFSCTVHAQMRGIGTLIVHG
jgi:plastocyanin